MVQFSVIIPNYNHAAFLRERIDSVLAQTCQQFELIILDDHSTDDSKAVIESYRQHPKLTQIIYASQNSGSPFGQWQKGIALASHDWIWIAESDDIAQPSFLETAGKRIAEEPNASLFFCNSLVEMPGDATRTSAAICNDLFQTTTWDNNYSIDGQEEINRALKYRSSILNASAVVFNKHRLMEKAAELNKFRYYGDWFAYLQILSAGNILYESNVLNRFRRTDSSHSQQMTGKDRIDIKTECFRILKLLLNSPFVTDKKELRLWFIKKYLGFGIKTDGARVILKTALKYYSINAGLATKVLWGTFLLKLSSKKKK